MKILHHSIFFLLNANFNLHYLYIFFILAKLHEDYLLIIMLSIKYLKFNFLQFKLYIKDEFLDHVVIKVPTGVKYGMFVKIKKIM